MILDYLNVIYLSSKFWVLKETYCLFGWVFLFIFFFIKPAVFLQVASAEELKEPWNKEYSHFWEQKKILSWMLQS